MSIFQKSIEVAHAINPIGRHKSFHITCIWDKNKLITVSQNSKKTHTLNIKNNVYQWDISKKSSCSELRAILKTKKIITHPNWKKFFIINIRINKHNQLSMAKPCIFCDSMLKYFDCKNIWFTNKEGEFEKYFIEF